MDWWLFLWCYVAVVCILYAAMPFFGIDSLPLLHKRICEIGTAKEDK